MFGVLERVPQSGLIGIGFCLCCKRVSSVFGLLNGAEISLSVSVAGAVLVHMVRVCMYAAVSSGRCHLRQGFHRIKCYKVLHVHVVHVHVYVHVHPTSRAPVLLRSSRARSHTRTRRKFLLYTYVATDGRNTLGTVVIHEPRARHIYNRAAAAAALELDRAAFVLASEAHDRRSLVFRSRPRSVRYSAHTCWNGAGAGSALCVSSS